MFPEPALVGDLDWDRLAQFTLSGGSIFNAALAASHEAAQGAGARVDMPLVLDAIRWELRGSKSLRGKASSSGACGTK